MSDLYDTDVALWAERQADALRRRAANELDWNNVAEEIESLARSDRREIRHRLAMICEHLLKWQFQPAMRLNSRHRAILDGRLEIAGLIKESPSLAPYPATVLADAYSEGRALAEAETGFGGFPDTCPWTIDQLLDPAFWPEAEPLP